MREILVPETTPLGSSLLLGPLVSLESIMQMSILRPLWEEGKIIYFYTLDAGPNINLLSL